MSSQIKYVLIQNATLSMLDPVAGRKIGDCLKLHGSKQLAMSNKQERKNAISNEQLAMRNEQEGYLNSLILNYDKICLSATSFFDLNPDLISFESPSPWK